MRVPPAAAVAAAARCPARRPRRDGAVRAPSGEAAQAVGVFCGQTLTASTTVANDLTNCPGDGLVIGAAGITLDLNGHTIDGQLAGFGIRSDRFVNVTIEHGTITASSGASCSATRRRRTTCRTCASPGTR
jgi:hypothetical protein